MKHIIALIMAVVAIQLPAAENPKTVAKPDGKAKVATDEVPEYKSWIDSISIAPVGAVKTAHLDGPSQWGAGLDIAYAVNPFVQIRVLNLSFEGADKEAAERGGKASGGATASGEDKWGGLLVDETDILVDAKVSRFSNETFSLHLAGGAQTDWNDNNYGVNVGAGINIDFNKNVGLGLRYSLRTWLKGETKVDSLISAQVDISF